MAAWQGGFPAPANSTTGETTIMNAPAASSHGSARLDLRAALGAADDPRVGHGPAPLAWR